MMNKPILLKQTALCSAMILALSACSSSDSDDNSTPDENQSPTITSDAILESNVQNEYRYTLAANDNDGDTISFSASSLPDWLAFDSSTGTLSGTPTESDVGSHDITLTVTDGSVEVSQSFTLTVNPAENAAPEITSAASGNVKVGELYSYTITATDDQNDTLVFNAVTLPTWLYFDAASGVLSGTPTEDNEGANAVVLSVSDGENQVSDEFSINVTPYDQQTGDGLVIFEDATNPKWPAWDCCGGSTPSVVMDDETRGNTTEFTINGDTVVGYNSRPEDDTVDPTPFDATAITADGTFRFDLKLLTAPEGNPDWKLKLESNNNETHVEVNLSTAQEGHVAPALDTWQTYTFNLADLESAGLDMSKIDIAMIFPAWGQGNGAVFRLDNVKFKADGSTHTPPSSTAPNITCTPTLNGYTGEEYNYTLTAVDADGDPLTLSSPTLPAWLNFDVSTGVLSGTPEQADIGEHSVSLAISDGSGTIIQDFSLTISEKAVATHGAITIYNDQIDPKWTAWDCCAGSVPALVEDDAGYGNVTEFTINGDTVVGFTSRAALGAIDGAVHDVSQIATDGTLSFDLKMMTSPGDTDWKLKVESSDGATAVEVSLTTSIEGHAAPELNTWQHYTFNLAELAASGLDMTAIDIVMIFPAWGTGTGAVYRVDNVEFKTSGAEVSSKPDLPLDFEMQDFSYELTDFGGNASSLVSDPDPAGARGTVAQSIKTSGAELWAGTTTSGAGGLANAVPLIAENSTMTLWVYAPQAGLPVRLKLENAADTTQTVETEATTTTANSWELLTFDFNTVAEGTQALNPAFTFDKASVFFNFGTDGATAGEMTFYWDGLTF